MGKQRLIIKLVKEELEKYKRLQARLEAEYGALPKGSLIKRKNGGISISVRDKGQQYQIALSPDDELIAQLKKKRYIRAGREPLVAWIDACQYFLENGQLYDPAGIEATLPNQYAGLGGIDVFPQGEPNPADWKNSINEESRFYSEGLIHQTPGGIRMRSKSEVLIGTLLEKRGIPYKYETKIECGDKWYSPDFELLQSEVNRLVYIEHLGMIDDPVYMARNLDKLKEYAHNGIVLGYNLFITYESRNNPLSVVEINKVIDEILALEF